MLFRSMLSFALAALLCGAISSYGQEATEMFIPIGQSPGVSDKVSHIGTIDTADQKKRTVVVDCDSVTHTFVIDKNTAIWIDRSLQKLSAQYGKLEDLQPGRKVEVYVTTEDSKTFVKWIKVQP
jgi:hypothetical protein